MEGVTHTVLVSNGNQKTFVLVVYESPMVAGSGDSKMHIGNVEFMMHY